MDNQPRSWQFDRVVRRLAANALRNLPKNSPAYREAKLRSTKPMDYLRCLEFPLAQNQLKLADGMRALDVASPQWFSLAMAHHWPLVEFTYVNILESELAAIQETARCLDIKNIRYQKEDCRQFSFPDLSFDRVISISTIEHIDPDVGGDRMAFDEICRVLRPRGEFTFSVPLRSQRSLVYDDKHDVWERSKGSRNFYLRNYDWDQLSALVADSGFELKERSLMHERPGLFAMDYWEGGPGKVKKSKDWVIKAKKKIDKLSGLRLEGVLAARYLHADSNVRPADRLVNVVCTAAKGLS